MRNYQEWRVEGLNVIFFHRKVIRYWDPDEALSTKMVRFCTKSGCWTLGKKAKIQEIWWKGKILCTVCRSKEIKGSEGGDLSEMRSKPRISWKWDQDLVYENGIANGRRDQNLVHRDRAYDKSPPDVRGIEAGACNGISQTSKNEVDTFS